MVVAHLSDTHLGYRPGNVRDMQIERKYMALEDDFYRAWNRVVDDIVENRCVDVVIHSGDLFDSPWVRNHYPPSEMARNVVAGGLERLERNNIPVILIGGNHGYYLSYRVSTLDHYRIAFDNVYSFGYWDFVSAFGKDKPLSREFDDFIFYAFPYVDPGFLENLEKREKVRQWIRRADPERGRTCIASCHGSTIDDTLDPQILNAGFDYVALGHDHTRKRLTSNAWFAGSTERWSFKEADQEKGYLLVDVGKDSPPDVTEVSLPERRPMINEVIEVTRDDTALDVRNQILGILREENLVDSFDYETAGRVKFTVKGDTSQETTTRMYRELESIKREALHSDDLNVIQFSYNRELPERTSFPRGPTYSDIEYLIENPGEEIISFLEEKGEGQKYDLELMAELFKEGLGALEEER